MLTLPKELSKQKKIQYIKPFLSSFSFFFLRSNKKYESFTRKCGGFGGREAGQEEKVGGENVAEKGKKKEKIEEWKHIKTLWLAIGNNINEYIVASR